MKNLNQTAEELFAKIRGRFPGVTIGDEAGNVTQEPSAARFFEFPFREGAEEGGKISITLSEEDGVVVMYNQDIAENDVFKSKWYDFLKELRQFAKKRMLNFETRDITKSNLQRRDYKYLANRSEESKMNESKMYGTSRISYQNVDGARLVIKHTESINQEIPTGRTQKIGKIYIESADGERFMYPYKHLSGARAMARHVAEGGKPFDDFGTHITSLSEELAKLRKFKTYMGRSAVMAESLSEYMDVVRERIATVKKTVESLQKANYYKEAFESFEKPVFEDVPDDVKENWIDQLTIKQFNEELADVFPYIYNLVSEATKAKALGPNDLDESGLQYYTGKKKYGKEGMAALAKAGREGASEEELGAIKDKYKKTKEEFELEQAFEDTMGQFADSVCEDCGNPSWRTLDEEKQKGVDGKVCWKGYKRMGTKMKGGKRVDNCVKMEADDLEEAYIKTSKDAIETLGALRKIGKSIERGQGTYDGNLANMYVNDVWDVYTWLENHSDINSDPKVKPILKDVFELRKKAKTLETKPGSGSNAEFGNQIVNTLYPLMQWIEMNVEDVKEGFDPEEFEGEFDYDAVGDDGEEDAATVTYKANIDDNGRPVVDPKSIKVHASGNNPSSKLGYDVDSDTEMQDMKELLQMAQEDADEMWDSRDNKYAHGEGNAYAHAVRKAKMDGKKKGDKVKGPDGDEITLEKEDKTPLGEFILSYYDRETGEFPKGETAVLTMIEKDYGEEFIEPAKAFIERVNQTFVEFKQAETQTSPEFDRMRELAGLR